MKNITLVFFILTINTLYCQRPGIAYEANTTMTKDSEVKYDEISGSAFLQKDFTEANTVCCNQSYPMRYDIYADEIQYKKDNIVYTLLKNEPYSKIVFEKPNTVIVLANINNVMGYYVQLLEGRNSLLKKISKKLEYINDTKKTGFGLKDKTSFFKDNDPIFYIKTENSTYHVIRNKKDLLQVCPKKSIEIEDFIKTNKIKFNKDESLINAVKFINDNSDCK
jgi:hypothetical protein